MIDLKDMQREVHRAIKTMDPSAYVQFKCFKKDRSVTLKRMEEDFSIEEVGFQVQTYEHLSEKEAEKIMKKLQDIEFPRSSRFWKQTGKNQ